MNVKSANRENNTLKLVVEVEKVVAQEIVMQKMLEMQENMMKLAGPLVVRQV